MRSLDRKSHTRQHSLEIRCWLTLLLKSSFCSVSPHRHLQYNLSDGSFSIHAFFRIRSCREGLPCSSVLSGQVLTERLAGEINTGDGETRSSRSLPGRGHIAVRLITHDNILPAMLL